MKLVVTRPEMRFKLAYIGSGTGGDSDLFWEYKPSGCSVEDVTYARIGGLATPRPGGTFYNAFCFHLVGGGESVEVRRKLREVAMAVLMRMAVERVMTQYDEIKEYPAYRMYTATDLALFYRHTVQIDL